MGAVEAKLKVTDLTRALLAARRDHAELVKEFAEENRRDNFRHPANHHNNPRRTSRNGDSVHIPTVTDHRDG